MNFTHPMQNPGIKQDSLSCGCLSCINVSHDANIANFLQSNYFTHINLTYPSTLNKNFIRAAWTSIPTIIGCGKPCPGLINAIG
jgi:hypothetical protein